MKSSFKYSIVIRIVLSVLIAYVLYSFLNCFGTSQLLVAFSVVYFFWEFHYRCLVYSYRKVFKNKVLRHVLLLIVYSVTYFVFLVFLFRFYIRVNNIELLSLLYFVVLTCQTGIHVLLMTLRQYEYQVYRELREKKINLEEKYKAIKSKTILHFLQNSLQATQKLIALDPAKATVQIESLTTLLRALLYNRNRDFISLKEELDLVKEFVHLLELQGNVKIVFSLEDDPRYYDKQIPPFVLILIFDNIFVNRSFIPYAKLHVYVENGIYLVAKHQQLTKASLPEKQEELMKNLKQRYSITNQETNVVRIGTAADTYIKVPLLGNNYKSQLI